MGVVAHTERIRAGAEACFAAAIDFETYPSWQSLVHQVEILSRDAQGRGREVSFQTDLRLRVVRYTLRYEYSQPTEISWTYAGGDAKDVTGTYTFTETTDGLTEARYALDVDIGVAVPSPIRNRLQKEFMRRTVRELKARVEAGGGTDR